MSEAPIDQVASRPPKLLGRQRECDALVGMLTDALAGRSQVVVLRGEAGVGKSTLLDFVSKRLDGWHVARAAGVESEMELAYSGVHQLCVPMLDRLDRLPSPQSEALSTVFGLTAGPPPEQFLVGLGVLSLFAEVAEEQPLMCMIEDAQWLDQASERLIGFVARRLLAERIVILCATRTDQKTSALDGLPDLVVGGLEDGDARSLLLSNMRGPLDAAVCDQIVSESHGNPLALLELPRTWRAGDFSGAFGFPDSEPVPTKIEQSYLLRLLELPSDTQLLVLTAAAEPLGDLMLLHRAAASLGLDMAAADAATNAGLLKIGGRVEFTHPLVRSAAYRSADGVTRRRVHDALATATDAEIDPDRRAWHRARSMVGPGEEVAAELERSAGRAQSRGGVAAAAAFLQRAVALTVDPAIRSERAIAAAQAAFQAGAFDAALGLLVTAEAGPLDEYQSARVDLVRAQVAFASGMGQDAPPALMKAAQRLEPFDVDLARETYLAGWAASGMAKSIEGRAVLIEISEAVLALPRSELPRPLELLVDGLAMMVIDGHAAATPVLQAAATALIDIPAEDVLRWGWMAISASAAVWDLEGLHDISSRQVQLVRQAGALGLLPIYLSQLGMARPWMGDLAGTGLIVAELESVAAAIGSPLASYTLLRLLSLQGSEADAMPVIASAFELSRTQGQGMAAAWAHYAEAVLFNGLARYEQASSAAQHAAADDLHPWPSMWALPELVEAATRAGAVGVAREALDRLAESTIPCANDLALGIDARCRALLCEAIEAEDCYREAIERLSRTRARPDLARAHLLYGEWLRREGRRTDARGHLRTAHDSLAAIGMVAFAERARRELVAAGEKVRERSDDTRGQLTAHEEQIARLASEGLSNPEIGAQLFISARTVEWHLGKVYTKLDISSRRQLRTVLPESGALLPSA